MLIMDSATLLPLLLIVWMTLTASDVVFSKKGITKIISNKVNHDLNEFVCIVDTTKIVGGQIAGEGNATYQVSLQIERPSGSSERYFHFCSGTILSERHVVTAAHCLTNWEPSEISVVAGTSVWNSGGVRRIAKKFESHADYMHLGGNDIAIITLDEPLAFGKMVMKNES